MPIRSDFHLHSAFSADSDTPMEKQVLAALQADLACICFTEHYDPDWPYANTPPEDAEPFIPDMPAYFAEIGRLQKQYGDRIRILAGLEIGMADGYEKKAADFAEKYPMLDFVIGSIHSSRHMDPYYPTFFRGIGLKEAIRQYFEDTLLMVQRCDFFQSLGHLDYVLRYGIRQADDAFLQSLQEKGESFGAYCFEKNRDLIAEILRELVKKDRALEVNTQSLAKARGTDPRDLHVYRETNPGRQTLLLYHDLGGKLVTVGADAHVPDGVGAGFSDAERLLLSTGFTTYVTYEKKEPVFHPI